HTRFSRDWSSDVCSSDLGQYMLEGYAIESTNQETIPEFVTDADYKSNTFKTYFEVGNYQPMAELYLDKPIERTPVDVYFMVDKRSEERRGGKECTGRW